MEQLRGVARTHASLLARPRLAGGWGEGPPLDVVAREVDATANVADMVEPLAEPLVETFENAPIAAAPAISRYSSASSSSDSSARCTCK